MWMSDAQYGSYDEQEETQRHKLGPRQAIEALSFTRLRETWNCSLFRARGAVPRRRHQKLAFGSFYGFQFDRIIALASFVDLNPEIVDLASFRFDRGRRTDALGGFFKDAGLPFRAQLMVTGLHREEKIRLAL